MNTQSISKQSVPLAVLMLAMLWQLPAYAQQSFDFRNQPQNSNRGFSANRSTDWSPSSVATPARENEESRLDFERVRSAWENYRREAVRYQARYGDQNFLRSGGRRFESRSPRTTVNTSTNAWRDAAASRDNSQLSRVRDYLTPAGNIRDIQSSDFDSRSVQQRPERFSDCPHRRRAAESRPRLAPLTPPPAPFQELDRGELQPPPFTDFRPSFSDSRDSFESRPLRTIPTVPASRSRTDQQRGTGLFSTPKIDPSQLASRASTFFSSHLGN